MDNTTDLRVVRTRQLLKDALMGLIREQSYESITVQQIAEAAPVNRSTFYAHFDDKDDLLAYVVHETFDAYLAEHLPTEDLTALVRAVFTFVQSWGRGCHPPNQAVYHPMFDVHVQNSLTAYLRAHLPGEPDDARREAVAATIGWTVFGAAVQWARGKLGLGLNEMVAVVMPSVRAAWWQLAEGEGR